MSDYITVPLSKSSKTYAGHYCALVDSVDSDLSKIHWRIMFSSGMHYAVRTLHRGKSGTTERLHRVIMERMLERKLKRHEQVDHINHLTLDNRRSNLRLATNAQNQHNRKSRMKSTSRYKGVNFHKQSGKWIARISIDKKRIHLGYFDTELEAHEAYKKASIKLHGEFSLYS